MRKLYLGLVLLLGLTAAHGNTAYREILEASYPSDGPGAAVLVVKKGEVVYRDAHGMANIELGVPLRPDHVFRLGSITKQFTGAAIMLLVEEGKVDLDAPIQTYLPDYPDHGHTITTRHLLTHTSGIFSYTSIPGYMGSGEIRADLTTDELVEVFDDLEMNFAPGERYSYSNSGYVLAGAIIEKVSGMSYADFVQQRIFDPLGMTNSHYGGPQMIPGRASGYSQDGEGVVNAEFLSMTQPHAAGSLLSSVDDMQKWNEALFGGEILSKESMAEMIKPFELNDGEESRYGLGLSVEEFRGETSVSHGGGIHGFTTHGRWLPDQDIYVIALTNTNGQSPQYLADRLASVAMGRPHDPQPAADLDESALQELTGAYQVAEGDIRNIFLQDGRLYSQRTNSGRFPVIVTDKDTIYYEESFTYARFKRNRKGEVVEMKFYPDGATRPQTVKRIGPPEQGGERVAANVSPEMYDLWAGEYEIQPGFTMVITRQGDSLMSQATGQPMFELVPASATRYFVREFPAELEFTAGDDGRASQLTLYQGGQEMVAPRVGEG
ncbi:MAG: serine hydrolase [Xanthomonadales bacterium]|nr:serine hydrolase [Xanthomonadales bacterium]